MRRSAPAITCLVLVLAPRCETRTRAAWLLELPSLELPCLELPSVELPSVELQGKVPPDPYTGGEKEAMRAAGYVSFGPFPFADGHDTRAIEALLGKAPLHWLETAHFKIGSSLPRFDVPRGDGRYGRKILAELTRLHEKIPSVKPHTRRLDPWLRLHLFAQRLEDTYADFQHRLGVTDADFPGPEGGLGAPLGMRGKFTVLLLERESSIVRYFKRFAHRDVRISMRHHFAKSGSLFYGTAIQLDHGWPRDDTYLHCAVVFNVVHNLVDGYRGYGHEIPVWFKAGLAQWYLRHIDPRYNNYDRPDATEPDLRPGSWDWQPRIRGLLRFGRVTPIGLMLSRRSFEDWKLGDYMTVWSRVDYLMSLGDERFRVFLTGMKAPFHGSTRLPSTEEILVRQEEMLDKAYGLHAASFDARWRAWVLAHYRKHPLRRPPG